MVKETALTLGERLTQVLDHLGLPQAHFCVRGPADLIELGSRTPDRIASIIVQGSWGNPRDLSPFVDRTLFVLGDGGAPAKRFSEGLAGLGAANVHWLKGYPDLLWSNTVADCTAEIAEAVLGFLAQRDEVTGPVSVSLSEEGEIAGITYHAAGKGTPVVLLPLQLSAQQWSPLLPLLQARHCTVVLGGNISRP